MTFFEVWKLTFFKQAFSFSIDYKSNQEFIHKYILDTVLQTTVKSNQNNLSNGHHFITLPNIKVLY